MKPGNDPVLIGQQIGLKKARMVSGVLNLFCAVPLQSFVVFFAVAQYWQVHASSYY
jgi:hypothetical protein